ncbi:hypothetical protein HU200_061138 [Digitaria exilis]|uniref:Ubiquitin-like protease family profile domain-containing protein n=1 Tax=Digitaria exilis TaxID=1010633 RepID=A0A835AAY9_9POAL|nr:hypothetical protein HU200_061138 [Digitaria exilis]
MFPVHHADHWTVYCINLVHEQIDILDSVAWATEQEMKRYHRGVATKIRERLNKAIQSYTHSKFTDFNKWDFVFVPVPKQEPLSNDCAFFVVLFLEYYDGEKRKMDIDINPVSAFLLGVLFVFVPFCFYFLLHPPPHHPRFVSFFIIKKLQALGPQRRAQIL